MPDVFIANKKNKKKKIKKKTNLRTLRETTTNPLAAFVANPRNLRFETQERKEKIVLLLQLLNFVPE